ncbi:MAG TPA: DUF1344 domain-containing protein [Geminicoccaceae bacterium]|nr:DUF1344 domain-containing protein [Geminicoccaceae bacterium]
MRKPLATVATLALIGGIGAAPLASALAAQPTPPAATRQQPMQQQVRKAGGAQQIAGTVKSVDTKMGTFTLADGHSFVAGPNFRLANLKPGERVDVTYEVQNGKWIAESAAYELAGTIRSIDAKKGMLTLSDGHSFIAGPRLKLAGIKSGEKVRVTYDINKDGKWVAEQVQRATS